MPRFEPFPALRYRRDALDQVAAPPYDVLSLAERAELASRHPRNIVHIDVPLETDGPQRYQHAGQELRLWIDNGHLVADPHPSFTIYRMTFNDESGLERTTIGVIGALEVVDEGAGGVLPHERTTPKAKTDRLDLTRATLTNLSPIWGLSLAKGLTDLLRIPAEIVGVCHLEGVTHTLERVDDANRIAAISQAVSSHDVVIADGHHRYAISRTFRDEQRIQDSGTNGAAEMTMTYIGELLEEQLSVAAIHRLYHEISDSELRTALGKFFTITRGPPVTPTITHDMQKLDALVLISHDGRSEFLTPIPEMFIGIRDLDGARLEHALAGIAHEVSYQHGVTEVARCVASGSASAAVLIRPVTVAEIQRTAKEGLLMPPKSTFFTPKLKTGPVLRFLG